MYDSHGGMQVSCGWKHNASVGRRGQLLTWGWGGSQGSQSFYESRCSFNRLLVKFLPRWLLRVFLVGTVQFPDDELLHDRVYLTCRYEAIRYALVVVTH